MAHCIAGGVRGFPRPEQSAYIANFVRGLAANGTYPHDVFMHLSTDKDVKSGASVFSDQDLQTAINVLAPKAVEFANSSAASSYPITTRCSNASGYGPVCTTGSEFVCRFYGQFDKVARAFALVERHEAAHSFRYTWVTRLRPDTYFTPVPPSLFSFVLRDASVAPVLIPIEVEEDVAVGEWSNAVTDEFAIVPRRLASDYFSAKDAIDMCAPLAELWSWCPGYWVPLNFVRQPRPETDGDPEPKQHFLRQAAANASVWPTLSAEVYAELALTHWLRSVRRVPLVNVSELTETQIFISREDGTRVPGARVMA